MRGLSERLAEGRQNNFDLIRLFAASQVMIQHTVGWLEIPHFPGWQLFISFPGVAIFFVVSGFLITGSYIASGRGTLGYFKARALRIYPALWVNLAVLLILMGIGGNLKYGPFSPDFWTWVAVAVPSGSDYLARHISPIWQTGFYRYFPSGVLWTLPVEMSFYFLVPLLFGRFARERWLMPLLLFGSICLSLYCLATLDREHYPIFIGLYLWIFLLGATIRVYWETLRPFLAGKLWFWLPLFIVSVLATNHDGLYTYTVVNWRNVALTVILACAVISAAFTAPRLGGLLKGNDISYGIYLWHMPFVWTLLGWGLTGSIWYAFCAFTMAVVTATASWQWVEKPALRLKNRAATPWRRTVLEVGGERG